MTLTQLSKKQKIIILVLFTLLVFAAVMTVYILTKDKPYPPLPQNPAESATTLKQIKNNGKPKLVLSETTGGGNAPKLLSRPSALTPQTLSLFYLSSSSLNIINIDEKGERLSDLAKYSQDDAKIQSFDLTQNGDEGFLLMHRLRNERHELVLEKLNKDLLPVQSSVLFTKPVSESFFGPSRESFDDTVVTFSDGSLYIFTKTIAIENAEAKFHVRGFDKNLKPNDFEKDIPVQKTKLAAGNTFAPIMTTEKNYLIVTTQRHGTSLCQQPDETSQTELMALVYDKDWNPLNENVVLTDHKRITHHPISARFHEGKIFVLYYVNDSERPLPQCTNGDIPKEGILKLDIYNTNLKRLQSIDVHDGTGGLAQLASLLPVEDVLYIAYALKRQETVDATAAIMIRSYHLSERETKKK